MKVLMLTWEFPPFISGGLGVACHGLFRALLSRGDVEIFMLLPAIEPVYFPLRRECDVDLLPMTFFDPSSLVAKSWHAYASVSERLMRVGLSMYPEAYVTPGFDFKRSLFWLYGSYSEYVLKSVDMWSNYLGGVENIFKKVQEFTAMAMRYARFLDFDIIHAHDWLTYPAAILLKSMTGKPVVAHIHATEFDRAGGPGDERIHKIEYNGLMCADRVVAVSRFTARIVADRYKIPEEKIRVVYNAHSFADRSFKERSRIFKDPVVLFLGRVTLQKGPDYFLEVAKKVFEKHQGVRFIVAGTGDMFTRLVKGSAAKKLRDRFLFAGFLDRAQVEKILSATDIFVMPSVAEPFGIAPLEAMAFGAVAIISKQSGVAEVVKNAIKVDFWDVDKMAAIIVDLLEDSVKRREIAEAGREEVLRMQWREAAGKVADIYRELI